MAALDAWSVVVALVTGFTGLLVLFAVYLWRGGHKRASLIPAAMFAFFAVAIIAGAVSGGSTDPAPPTAAAAAVTTTAKVAAPPRACGSYIRTHRPQSCLSKDGFVCSSYNASSRPNDCLTTAQLRVRFRIAKARALAAAKARAVAAARAAARAKAQAVAYAAANAWHQGYTQQDSNVYWKWVSGGNCAAYSSKGCWHVDVITRDGCPSYVAVNANEYAGGSIINSLLDNQGFGIPAKTARLFELDADQSNVTARDVVIDCN